MRERRAFEFVFDVDVPGATTPTRLWIPTPMGGPWQKPLGSTYPEGLDHELAEDPVTGNTMAYFVLPPSSGPRKISVAHQVERTLRRPPDDLPRNQPPPDLPQFLEPNLNVPLDGVIAYQAQALGVSGEPPLVKARKAYDYLLETLTYDWAGCTPERIAEVGDLQTACDLRKGTCTEFHGLFVGYMRVLGVPARFCFGFNVPRKDTKGPIAGYHCWSEIALDEEKWFAIDVSEAWKRREFTEFYFGSLDADRVAFAYDRDVTLAPPQEGGPIDKWIFPYAEVRGEPVELGLSFRYTDL